MKSDTDDVLFTSENDPLPSAAKSTSLNRGDTIGNRGCSPHHLLTSTRTSDDIHTDINFDQTTTSTSVENLPREVPDHPWIAEESFFQPQTSASQGGREQAARLGKEQPPTPTHFVAKHNREPPHIPSELYVDSKPAFKHCLSEDSDLCTPSSSAPPSKRPRPKLEAEQILNPESFFKHTLLKTTTPQSPLFFSSSPRRSSLQARATSGEVDVSMMSKPREEGGITSLKLARGGMSSTPPHGGGIPGNWIPMERNNMARTPDSRGIKSAGMQILGSVGVIEFLEMDERPTFLIDLANPANFIPGGTLQILFANAQLRASEALLESVTGKADLDSPGIAVTNDFPEFKGWALSFVRNNEALEVTLPSYTFTGITWSCSTLRRRFRVISGSTNSFNVTALSSSSTGTASASATSTLIERVRRPSVVLSASPLAQTHEPMDYFGDMAEQDSSEASTTPQICSPTNNEPSEYPMQAMIASSETALTSKNLRAHFSNAQSFDWTRMENSAALPRHIQFVKSIDWSKTALGPMESWGFGLRAMCNLLMKSLNPAALYWGEDRVTIYNEAYILLAGQKHPKLMGQRYEDAWQEIWPEIEDVFISAEQLGQATMKDDDRLFIDRSGFLEECEYFILSWHVTPQNVSQVGVRIRDLFTDFDRQGKHFTVLGQYLKSEIINLRTWCAELRALIV